MNETDQTAPTSLPALYGAVSEIDEDMRLDAVLHLYNAVNYATQRMTEIKRVMNERLIDWINQNGDVTIGDQRLYVGNDKKIKCVNPQAVVDEYLDNHSIEDLVADLASNAFKYGAVRARLGDAIFDKAFVTEIVQDVKTGKPRKSVKTADSKFIK